MCLVHNACYEQALINKNLSLARKRLDVSMNASLQSSGARLGYVAETHELAPSKGLNATTGKVFPWEMWDFINTMHKYLLGAAHAVMCMLLQPYALRIHACCVLLLQSDHHDDQNVSEGEIKIQASVCYGHATRYGYTCLLLIPI
jgi:hypothetical protein